MSEYVAIVCTEADVLVITDVLEHVSKIAGVAFIGK